MAAPTYAELIAAYPSFTTEVVDEQTAITTWLSLTTDMVSDLGFSTAARAGRARLQLGAHFVTMDARTRQHGGGGVGAITSRTNNAGNSVSYASPQTWMSENILGSTRYGQAFLMLWRGSGIFGPIT